MNMKRKKALMIQVIVLLALLPMIRSGYELYLFPEESVKVMAEENGFHTPKIVGKVQLGENQLFFSNSGKWTMVSQVEKHAVLFWREYSDPLFFNREKMKAPFDYLAAYRNDIDWDAFEPGSVCEGLFYGFIGDPEIVRIEAQLLDGRTLPAQFLEGGIFYINHVPGKNVDVPPPNNASDWSVQLQWQVKSLAGYDKNGKIIYEYQSFDPWDDGDIRLPMV